MMNRTKFTSWLARTLWDAGWAPLGVFGLHVLASRVFNAYAHYPYLDIPMHFFGGVAIAFFFHAASRNASRYQVIGPHHRLTHVALVFAFTCTATVFWEFAEFLSDRYLGTRSQGEMVGDTVGDMFFGIAGGIVFLAVSQVVCHHIPPGDDFADANAVPNGALHRHQSAKLDR